MSMTPIYVAALSRVVARNFVQTDLCEDPRRLVFIDDPNHLRGLSYAILYLHSTASRHPKFAEICERAALQGMIIATVDDSHARRRYAATHL